MTPQRKKTKPAFSISPRLVRRAGELTALLRLKKKTLITAESCTGGLIAAALSQTDGASDVLEGGFVTYTKAQKTRSLGVGATVLKRNGAVAGEIARRMALGALKRSRAKIALAVTGVLGPKPDDDGNPVGLVFFACAKSRGKVEVLRQRFDRCSHDRLRSLTVLIALDMVERTLRKK